MTDQSPNRIRTFSEVHNFWTPIYTSSVESFSSPTTFYWLKYDTNISGPVFLHSLCLNVLVLLTGLFVVTDSDPGHASWWLKLHPLWLGSNVGWQSNVMYLICKKKESEDTEETNVWGYYKALVQPNTLFTSESRKPIHRIHNQCHNPRMI